MSRLHFLNPVSSAPVARERLQNLLENDRRLVSHTDLITVLREEIYALVGRHAAIDPNKVQVMVVRGATTSTLAVDIEVPNRGRAAAPPRRTHDSDGKSVLSYR
jgi:cell division topological specificity factor